MAYERFAQSYPESPLAAEARQRADRMKEEESLGVFEDMKKVRKASTLERFIKEHRGTKAATLAKLRIAEIDFHDLSTQNPFKPFRPTNSTWEGFLGAYAFGDAIPVPKDPQLRKVYYEKLHPLLLQALEKLGSLKAWVGYLITYPDSPYFEEATRKIESFLLANADNWDGYEMLKAYLAVFDQRLKRELPNRKELVGKFQAALAKHARQENTIDDYKRYLEAFPDSPFSREIRIAEGHLEFNEALLQNDRAGLEKLIDKFKDIDDPQTRSDLDRARKRIQRVDFQEATQADTPAALYAFKKKYQDADYGNLIPAADRQLQSLRLAALKKIRGATQAKVFDDFLKAFPDAPERSQVEAWREEAEFNKAIADGTRRAIEKFLAKYPNSRFRKRALDNIEKIIFQKAAATAKSRPTTSTLAAYLEQYPRGAFSEDASRLIAEINAHYADYMHRYQAAHRAGDYRHFGEWLSAHQDNYYAAAHGQQDLVTLKREVTVRQLVADATTTPSRALRRPLFSSIAALIEDRSRAIATVENGRDNSTGFLFTRDGLLLTNARLVRGLAPVRITASVSGKGYKAQVVRVASPAGPDAAILRIKLTAEPIPLGNPGALRGGESLTCLSGRGPKVISSPGTFVALQTAGGVEWLTIKSTKIPVDLGGVILNPRAEAVGILVHFDEVNPDVREDIEQYVYAISIRSVLDLMKSAILGPGK